MTAPAEGAGPPTAAAAVAAAAPRARPLWFRLLFRVGLALWPPYLGAGVRVSRLAPDFTALEVRMGLRFWNRNWVGTHFGGSLFAMTDPFPMLMLLQLLGPGYVVWDKASSIRFRRPGRGTVTARFEIPAARAAEIRAAADAAGPGGKVEPVFLVEVRDAEGQLVAAVEKTLHVRRKAPAPAPGA